jgi:hypothetical protein
MSKDWNPKNAGMKERRSEWSLGYHRIHVKKIIRRISAGDEEKAES